jgi:membrane-bound ClpP family serine protease
MTVIGLIGFILLLLSYVILNTKFSKYFIPVDIISTIFLVIYSFQIDSLLFIGVNGFILVMLVINQTKKDKWRKKKN